MKFPNHIILDWRPSATVSSRNYWFLNLFADHANKSPYDDYLTLVSRKKISLWQKNSFGVWALKKFAKKTLIYKNAFSHKEYSQTYLKYLKNISSFFYKVKFKTNPSYSFKNFNLINDKAPFHINKLFSFKKGKIFFRDASLWNMFDIHFLRKEKIYTKLKYSRVPQYDIVSGGAAALMAGFLGFLICEKFGFELLDSGDFYIFMMYIVFFCFFLRPFIRIYSSINVIWSPFSIKWFFNFYKTFFIIHLNILKSFFKKNY